MHVLVSYDVRDDRRRVRLMKMLKGFLEHVQKSVFEGELSEGAFGRLRAQIPGRIDMEEDGVRLYRLCSRCRLMTEVIGVGVLVDEGDGDVVV